MKIGIIVDGQAEFRSLPAILERVRTRHTLQRPVYADIQPFAPVAQVVHAVKGRLAILRARSVDRIVILVDREARRDCPGAWAREVEKALARGCSEQAIPFSVVVKDRCYENWLIADVSALEKLRARFSLSQAAKRAIQPNKADLQNAPELLKRAAKGGAYSKVEDALRIMRAADPLRIAGNSRSFRRFLREAGSDAYGNQSKVPAGR